MADPRESIEVALLTALQAIEPPTYDVPQRPRLVTREVLDFSQTQGRRPALVLIMGERQSEAIELGDVTAQIRLPGVVRVDLDPVAAEQRATVVNQWYEAIDQALEKDFDASAFPGLDFDLRVTAHDQPAIASSLDLMQAAVHFEVNYLLDWGA